MSGGPANNGPQARTPAQRVAADPARHVWVAASAGTGKTHVLTDRILRLMLEGSPPDRILALTFTKAAAAEMQNRLVKRLGDWLGYDDARLDAEFEAMGVTPGTARRHRARALFAQALDVPGGLKVQTLHAFSQGLLASFPLEAGLAPGFRALEERDARRLRRQALADAISDAQGSDDQPFLADLAELAILKGEGGVTQALDAMIAHSDGLLRFRDAGGLEQAVRRWLDVGPDEKPGEALAREVAPGVFDDASLGDFARGMADWGTKTGLDLADRAAGWLARDAGGRADTLSELGSCVLTQAGETQKHSHAVKKQPDLRAVIDRLADAVRALLDLERRVRTAELAGRALRAGHRIVARYTALKRAALAIDYDDMIQRTVALLGPAGMPSYVGWKLDSRFDHVLVDEAQDTNDRQWAIIGRLIEDYFDADAGGRRRSLFVVGDHKQAIYGFQGTDPQVFESWRQRLSPGAEAAGRPIEGVDLDLSFRSGPAVLDVVNGFLASIEPDELGMSVRPPAHRPHRARAPGEVVLWPVITPEGDDTDAEPDEGTELEDGSEAADRAMAKWLAAQVAGWLKPGGPERLWLPAKGRWAEAGDVLLLLRKRSWLMGALVAELHEAGVPVAGVDRLLLTEPLAVLDCLALVRFAVQPEDDLTLAALLVSPFLGWDHEAIRALNGGRPGLWGALGRAAAEGGQAAEARAWLGAVLALADMVGPARFLDQILSGPLRGRQRLLARLGAQANDPIDELLQQALGYEQANPPALAGFLAWIEAEGSDVKRDAEAAAQQVRLMTIHGSKGLEAPVVVLADAAHQRRRRPTGYVSVDVEDAALPLFHPRQAETPQKLRDAQALLDQREAQEDLRLLYVGLTRAADHLFIGGAVSAKDLEKLQDGRRACWHASLAPVLAALPGVVREATPRGELLRYRAGDWTAPGPQDAALAPASAALALSEVLTGIAPVPTRPSRPVTPSGLPEAPPEGPAGGPAAEAIRAAAQRGRFVHSLFERLPAVPPPARREQAVRWLQKQGAGAGAEPLADQVLAVMADPALAALFGEGALAEAPIAGLVDGIAISGVVDRLLVEADRVLVVDFKTGLHVPASFQAAPRAHRRQMAAYRAVLARAFPGRRVEVALLYTAGPKFLLGAEKDMAGLLPLD